MDLSISSNIIGAMRDVASAINVFDTQQMNEELEKQKSEDLESIKAEESDESKNFEESKKMTKDAAGSIEDTAAGIDLSLEAADNVLKKYFNDIYHNGKNDKLQFDFMDWKEAGGTGSGYNFRSWARMKNFERNIDAIQERREAGTYSRREKVRDFLFRPRVTEALKQRGVITQRGRGDE